MSKMVTITRDAYDEYRVPAPDGREAGAYYTDYKDDAVAVMQQMYGADTKPRIKRVVEH